MPEWLSGAVIGGVAGGIAGGVAALVLAFLAPQRTCPECRNPLPKFRNPKNWRQRLWGGWTCERCGCEVDRRGRKVPT
jgi:hypothetical protein